MTDAQTLRSTADVHSPATEGAMTEQERIAAAEHLCATIARCHPDDAQVLLAGILQKFSAGMPIAPFLDDIALEAEAWTTFSHIDELQTYGQAIIRLLAASPFGIMSLKQLLVEVWDHLAETDRLRFLNRVDDCGRFSRKNAA